MHEKKTRKFGKNKKTGLHRCENTRIFPYSRNKTNQKKTLFKFRTKMEHFGENFRGAGGPDICTLCKLHLDNQEQSLQCKVVKSEINIKGKIEDIYKEEIKMEIVETITNIAELRKLKLKK